MTESFSSDRNPVEALADDFLRRQRGGERPTLEEYCRTETGTGRKLGRGRKLGTETGTGTVLTAVDRSGGTETGDGDRDGDSIDGYPSFGRKPAKDRSKGCTALSFPSIASAGCRC